MSLSRTQLLNFELGRDCNLGHLHAKCPNRHPERYAMFDRSRELDDDTIVRCAADAYSRHNFTGLVGWHYYCEPTLQADRMLRLMDAIKAMAPTARFILWSNGTMQQSESVLDRFAIVRITDYSSDPIGAKALDDRLHDRPAKGDAPCLRVFTEFVLDDYGNHHPCCYDWRGRASLGNVFVDGFDALVERWAKVQDAVGGRHMTDYAPKWCLECGWRTKVLTRFDESSAKRAEERRFT